MKIYTKRSLYENMCCPIAASILALFGLQIMEAIPYRFMSAAQTSDVTVMPNNKLVEKTPKAKSKREVEQVKPKRTGEISTG